MDPVTVPVVDGVPQVPAGYAIDQIVEVHAQVLDADGNPVAAMEGISE